MQGEFLVSIGGCDVHNHVLDIKNKERIDKNTHTEMLGMLHMSKKKKKKNSYRTKYLDSFLTLLSSFRKKFFLLLTI